MNWKVIITAILALVVLIVVILIARNVGKATFTDTDSATDEWGDTIQDCVQGENCLSAAVGSRQSYIMQYLRRCDAALECVNGGVL